ncbi:MAG: type II secretion system protein GspL [Tahibacter sp.]
MSQRLLIRLHADGRYTWLNQASDGRASNSSVAGLPPADVRAAASRIFVLVPSAQVVLLETAQVSKNRAQLVKAVPFALEDQLAQPVEDVHFALAGAGHEGRIGVAAVAHVTIKAWLDKLRTDGIEPDALVPEALALGVGMLLIEPRQAQIRFAEWRAASLEPGALIEWLGYAIDANSPPIEVFDTRDAPRLELPLRPTAYHERQRDALALLASGLRGEAAINLLQGGYAASHRQAPLARWWRLAALLAGAAVLLGFAGLLVERSQLQRESDRLEDTMHALLAENFPEMEKVAGEPLALMKSAAQRLGGGQSSGALLGMLAQIAPIVGSTTRVTTRGLEFRNGSLELAVSAPDVPTLDSLRERLATTPGFKVDVTSANPTANGIDGRLRISGTAP